MLRLLSAIAIALPLAAEASSATAILPTTCGAGSVAAAMDFCDRSLSFERRSELLTAHLTQAEKLALWSPALPTSPIPRVNLKGYMWDSTCIHGAAPYHLNNVGLAANVTVTAHAINLGATFDLDLVERISNMTAVEMRAVTQKMYGESNGTLVLALGCDGGPLANSAHDPRWGRISETYGEDPYLISRVGTVATRAMQGFVPKTESSATDGWLATALTTRHLIGYHSSNEMGLAQINVSEHDLYDTYLPAYQSYMAQREAWTGDLGGRAEAIMCSFARFNGVPSCASPRLLKDILREQWKSEALVQTDCCDSINNIYINHWNGTSTLTEATVIATEAGTQLQYTTLTEKGRAAYATALAAGTLTMAQLDASVARALLIRFRLGEFDDADSPYGSVGGNEWTPHLDTAAHRALARESASASAVLLKNADAALPLNDAVKSVGCIGAFANDTVEMLHSYTGVPSKIVTIDAALKGHAAAIGASYDARVSDFSYKDIANAVALVKRVEVAVLVLGLGSKVEAEGVDRLELGWPADQKALLDAVSVAARAAGTKLVLLIVSAGPVALNEARADAIMWVGYPGEEAGNGVVDVLWARNGVSPSGRLPVTWYGSDYLAQVGPELDYALESGAGRTYRYLDERKSASVYKFGFGLSFSQFKYSQLTVDTAGFPDLAVGVVVKNTGAVAAAAVAQLYVSVPEAGGEGVPLRALAGFQKVLLAPGQATRLEFRVVEEQQKTTGSLGNRSLVPGVYTVSVGGHQPGDRKGEAESNTVAAEYTVR